MNSYKLYIFVFTFCFCPLTLKAQSAKSDSLFASGVALYHEGKYCDAISFFLDCDSLDCLEMDTADIRTEYSSLWIASCYHKLGKDSIASNYSIYYHYSPINRQETFLVDSLSMLAIEFSQREEDEMAIKYILLRAEIEKQLFGEFSLGYRKAMTECGYCSVNIGNIENAIGYELIANRIAQEISGLGSDDYIESVLNLANYYWENNDERQTVYYLKELEKSYAILYNGNVNDYAESLLALSNYYDEIGNLTEAIRLARMSIELSPDDNAIIAESNYRLFQYMIDSGDFENAIQVGDKCLNLFDEYLTYSDSAYAICGMIKNRLAECYSNLGKKEEAIKLNNDALVIYKHTIGVNNENYSLALNNLAAIYDDIANFQKAIELEKELVLNIENQIGKNNLKYAIELSNLAYYYNRDGQLFESLNICEEAYKIARSLVDANNPDYLLILNNLADNYVVLGNFQRAIDITYLILQSLDEIGDTQSIAYARALNNLVTYLDNLENPNYDDLLLMQEQSVNLLYDIVGKDDLSYISAVSNLAVLQEEKGNSNRALELFIEALDLMNNAYSNAHSQKIFLYYNIANLYNDEGEYEKALSYLNLGLSEIEGLDLSNSPKYLEIKKGLYYSYMKLNNIGEMKKWMDDINALILDTIKHNFPKLASRERELFWNNSSDWFFYDLPQCVLYDTSEYVLITLYNSILLSKGILLNTGIEIEKLIEKENKSFAQEYKNIQDNQSVVNAILNNKSPIQIDVDSLIFEINSKERILISKSHVYQDIQNLYNIDMDDVEYVLNKQDIAIEFFTVPINNSDVRYYALCLRKGYRVPHLYYICSKNELQLISQNDRLSLQYFKNIIWKPLENELEGIRNIYFSPTGELCNVPIEYCLSIDDYDSLKYSGYNLYRLSSTRELVRAYSMANIESKAVALYGGLNYNLGIIDTGLLENAFAKERSSMDFSNIQLQPLINTMDEVISISNLFPQNYVRYLYTGDKGTEESFKNLGDKRLYILHIATHSFYWRGSQADYNKYRLRIGDDYRITEEDKALYRSGLFLSGVNTFLRGDTISDNIEDGILTAQEISTLDFMGLELVVLSSCQSGLGDIKGDGVFGLQRAFKKAGANSILMSLWDVDDFATRLLMTEFYRNYLSGINKQESLKMAQDYVRNYEDEAGNRIFSDPYYWASFILLDGLQ